MIHYMAGLQLFNEGLYNPAEIEFTVAIKYNTKVSGYWASRGKTCFYQYNYDGAFEDFKEALKLDPNNADVLSRMQQSDPDGKVLEEVGVGPPPPAFKPVNLTPLTSVNPHMAKASIVKDFVDSKRLAMSQTLSVNRRRSEHPIKKGDHWSVMEPKKMVYGSMADRKKMLEREKRKGGKKTFNAKKKVVLGASSKGIFS
ncbi:hypothetical protein TL16_g04001 [Triparma laevis f. inornata]|uniref:Tetratricopeptide repeat protein n=1 Tax=Triparma laevis f. inornata TaxID=1714386 RepID=A0A9W7AA23_9STRA|nr:hypothetical protein TL16_g04001 [Triparma laevis f. inornata]